MLRKLFFILFLFTLPLPAQVIVRDYDFSGAALGENLSVQALWDTMPWVGATIYPYVPLTVRGGPEVEGDSTLTPSGASSKFSAYFLDTVLVPPFEVRVVLAQMDPGIGAAPSGPERFVASIWMTPNKAPLGDAGTQQDLIVARYAAAGTPPQVRMCLTSTAYYQGGGQPWGQQNTGDYLDMVNQAGLTALAPASQWGTNDTLIFRFFSDSVISIGVRTVTGTQTDTAFAHADNAWNASTNIQARFRSMTTGGGYLGIGIPLRDSLATFADDAQVGIKRFTIYNLADTTPPPPPPGDTVNASWSNFSVSPASPIVGSTARLNFTVRDDSALYGVAVLMDTVSSALANAQLVYYDAPLGGNLKTLTDFANFSLSTADTVWIWGWVKDWANQTEVYSDTLAVVFRPAPPNMSSKVIFGYITFPSDIELLNADNGTMSWGTGRPPGANSGRVPIDSLAWEVLTHVSFFAADVQPDKMYTAQTAFSDTGNNPQYKAKVGYIAEYAHRKGAYAGFTFGGSGDEGLRNMLFGGINATDPLPDRQEKQDTLLAICLRLIDGKYGGEGVDFIDFDIEGRPYEELIANEFYAKLQDSLATRTTAATHDDPAQRPFFVLTIGSVRANRDAVVNIPYVDYVNIMSYDNAGGWWGQINHDNSVASWSNLDGSGTNLDPQNYAEQGGVAFPSMQEVARLLKSNGWPAGKILVGMDLNPTTVRGGTFSDGRGPTVIRKAWSGSPPSWSGSGLKFYKEWNANDTLARVPTDSVKWDPISKVTWAHTGKDSATDKMYLQIAWPGVNDSAFYYAQQVVDSMGIAGFMVWGLTETYGTSTPAPPGGWGWASNALEFYFDRNTDTVVTACVPPTLVSPATGTTGAALTTSLVWNTPSCGDTTYILVDTAGQNFANPKYAVKVTTDTSYAAVLDSGVTYEWKVRRDRIAGGGVVNGAFSVARTLRTILKYPTNAQVLLLPAETELLGTQTANHTWGAASVAGRDTPYTFQHFQADTLTGAWTGLAFNDSTMAGSLRAISRSYNLGDTIRWRMRLKNATGWGPWSATRTFYTNTGAPSIPTITRPVSGSTTEPRDSMLVQWSPGQWKGTSYKIQIDTSSTFATPLKDTTVNFAPTATAFSTRIFGLADSTSYRLRIRGTNSAGTGGWATVQFSTSGRAIVILPRATVQMNLYYDIVTGDWVWNTPSRWLMYRESMADMSDIPTPSDELEVAWSPYGIKTKDTTLLYNLGSGANPSPQVLADSLRGTILHNLRLDGTIAQNGIIVEKAWDTTFWQIRPNFAYRPPPGGWMLTLPPHDGEFVVSNSLLASPTFNSLTLTTPLGIGNGGTGIPSSQYLSLGNGELIATVVKSGTTLTPNVTTRSSFILNAGAPLASSAANAGTVPVVNGTKTGYDHASTLTNFTMPGMRLKVVSPPAGNTYSNYDIATNSYNLVKIESGAGVTTTFKSLKVMGSGTMVWFVNSGEVASDSVHFLHLDTTGAAALGAGVQALNQFDLPNDTTFVLGPEQNASFFYDVSIDKWRVMFKYP